MITTELEEQLEGWRGMTLEELEQDPDLRDLPQEDFRELIEHLQETSSPSIKRRAELLRDRLDPDEAYARMTRQVFGSDKMMKAVLGEGPWPPGEQKVIDLLTEIRDLLLARDGE